MTEERIMTKHPDEGKSGVNISKNKYDIVRKAIIGILNQSRDMTFSELGKAVNRELEGKFDGSVSWYYTTVKLDLEARGIVERVDKSSPQRLHLISFPE